MTEQLDISEDFNKAFELFEKGYGHLFVTGKAGCGKSTWLEYCCKNSSKNVVVLAPTGVAALNVGGQTVHRFFGFPINITPEKITSFEFTPRAKRIYKRLETIIIDEVSMLRADILDCIDAFLRLYGPTPDNAFGGVQMVFVGDLYQLPPVVTKQEEAVFYRRYAAPYFFCAEAFKKIALEAVEFKKIYRQTDRKFIELLNRIRANQVTDDDIELLNGRLNNFAEGKKEFFISLTTVNRLADEINSKKMEDLEGQLYRSTAVVDGDFGSDYFPTSENLEFKIGAQIMFLNNDSKNRWVNGSIAHIEDIKFRDDKVRYVKARLHENMRLVDVFPYTWEIYKYQLEGNELQADVVGAFTQYPFRPAWAVTIHKSQGKTFDKVQIDVGRGTFATGQLYVALSRCTSFEGIGLSKPIGRQHVFIDSRISDFMHQYFPENFMMTEESKMQFLQQAIRQRQRLEITYKKTDGTVSRRLIVPQSLKGENLLAYCLQRNAQRSFCISRVIDICFSKQDGEIGVSDKF